MNLETHAVDLRKPDFTLDADIVVLHSILRQIEIEYHEPLLANIAGWLGPRGSIVFSNRLHAPSTRPSRQRRLDILRERYERGEIQLSVPLQDIIDALVFREEWPHDYESVEEIRRLVADAGLVVDSECLIERVAGGETGAPRREDRYLATLRRKA